MPSGHGRRRFQSTLLIAATAAVLLFSLAFGGGQGWRGEALLAIPGLMLIVAAAARLSRSARDPQRLKLAVGLPLALVALPILQLIPLPPALWTALPGRADLVAGLAAAGVTPGWAPWSLDPMATERMLWSLMAPIGLFLAAVTLRGQDRRRLAWLAVGFAGASALLGLWQLMEGPDSALYFYDITNRGSAVGLFANRNHLASLLAVALPVTMGLLSDRLRHVRHGSRDLLVWLATALAVVLAVGVTATQSRAGFGLLMLSVLAAAAVGWHGRRAGQGAWTGQPWLKLAGGVAVVLVVQFTLYALLARLQTDPMDDYRWQITPRTLAAAAPLHGTGAGLGSFVMAYDEVGDAAADMPSYVNHAHNDYAELWLEGGLPAMLLAAGAIVLILAALRRELKVKPDQHDETTHNRGLQLGAAMALLLLALHSAADYPLRTLSLATFAALMTAILIGSVRVSGAARQAAGRLPRR